MGSAGPVGSAVLLAGALGGMLILASDFATTFSVDVVTATCTDLADPELADKCVTKGGEQHAYMFVVLGLLAVLMAWGAGSGGSRPAAVALVAIGIGVLFVAFASDLPDAGETGAVGRNFEGGEANPGAGLWLEIAGGALVTLAGLARLLRPDTRPPTKSE